MGDSPAPTDMTNRKIPKAIYLLLERHHRLHGLECYLFSGPHGAGYVGFQVAGRRCCQPDRPPEINYGYMHPEEDCDYLSLVTYLCGPIKLCDWSTRVPACLPGWETKRTAEISLWLEENLTLNALYDRYSNEIARWRTTATVEEAEKYLFMVHVAGLISARAQEMLRTPMQCFDHDSDGWGKAQILYQSIGVSGESDAIGLQDCMIGRNGKAIVHGSLHDIWEWRTGGLNAEDVADKIWSLRSAHSDTT
jgi:hypothetical protein